MRSRLSALAVAFVTTTAAGLWLAASPASAGMPSTGSSSILFSVASPSSTVSTAEGVTTLILPADASISWFADRPTRAAGTSSLQSLASKWSDYGFAKTPPNAALVMRKGGKTSQVVVILSKPRVADGNVSFTARTVPGNRTILKMHTMHPLMPGNYGDTEVFIDGASVTGLQFSQYCQTATPARQDTSTGAVTLTGNSMTLDDFSYNVCQRYGFRDSFGSDKMWQDARNAYYAYCNPSPSQKNC